MLRKSNRLASIILLLCFLTVLVVSYTFCVLNSNHECIGNDCCTCFEINVIQNTFEALIITKLLIIVIKLIRKCIAKLQIEFSIWYLLTPIKLKVQLTE